MCPSAARRADGRCARKFSRAASTAPRWASSAQSPSSTMSKTCPRRALASAALPPGGVLLAAGFFAAGAFFLAGAFFGGGAAFFFGADAFFFGAAAFFFAGAFFGAFARVGFFFGA